MCRSVAARGWQAPRRRYRRRAGVRGGSAVGVVGIETFVWANSYSWTVSTNSDDISRRASKRETRRLFAEKCHDEWLSFPDVPGRHLNVRRIGFQKYQLMEQNRVIATFQGRWNRRWSPKSIETGGKSYTIPIPGQDLISRSLGPTLMKDMGTVYEDASGTPVLCMYGQHFDLAEEASVELLPDRG